MSADVVIPDKDDFRIGEVCDIAGVKPFVLRYWETEFPELQPGKGTGGQRTYSRADVQLILRIKHLLYEERFTVAGAKKRLAEEASAGIIPAAPAAMRLDSAGREEVERLRRALVDTKRELEVIIALLR